MQNYEPNKFDTTMSRIETEMPEALLHSNLSKSIFVLMVSSWSIGCKMLGAEGSSSPRSCRYTVPLQPQNCRLLRDWKTYCK